ncbi:phosphatidylinositol 5-phosphate 4-kinase type-2 alpha-like isoform X3 [Bolinopsis microptera]|uniref:phosphatidylinositol 5-phosphate 4-kinase type-2 alpha-like isoform X3 n=2 Tax=Bolinopsis microptera TaxID=2820187 RepID=UPI00307A2A7C
MGSHEPSSSSSTNGGKKSSFRRKVFSGIKGKKGDEMPEVKKQKKRKAFKMKKKVFRSSDPLLSVFMWGVHQSVEQLTHCTIPPLLLDTDFKAFSKISIENYNFNSDNMTGKFKFKEYCPIVFKNLRDRFGVKEALFNQALSSCEPYYEAQGDALKEKERGHKYFYSKDNKFVVKIFHSEEVEFMHSILNVYYNYAVEKAGQTLLPQYLAMYKITVSSIEYHMIVMKNVFAVNLRIHKKYDLKGSKVDRAATDKDPTLKDCDFLNEDMKIRVGEEKRKHILAMLESDVQFLSQLKIMDYSLLLGTHNVAQGHEEREMDEEHSSSDDLLDGEEFNNNKDSDVPMEIEEEEEEVEDQIYENGYTYFSDPAISNKEVYCFGLIDVLTKYNATKRAAHTAKTMKHGSGAEISTVRPESYSKRFLEFMSNAFV